MWIDIEVCKRKKGQAHIKGTINRIETGTLKIFCQIALNARNWMVQRRLVKLQRYRNATSERLRN